jgi:PTH1 family peptidyl-tRNA hydrolase
MNESGQSIQLIAAYYQITPENIIVVHDDKDIPLGEIKVQRDRGHAGHNGIRSIIDHLGTKDFHRIRIGIANTKKQEKMDTADFVLGKFGLEKKVTQLLINRLISLKHY